MRKKDRKNERKIKIIKLKKIQQTQSYLDKSHWQVGACASSKVQI